MMACMDGGMGELLRVSGANWNAEMTALFCFVPAATREAGLENKNLEMIGADFDGYVFLQDQPLKHEWQRWWSRRLFPKSSCIKRS